jgi:tetratricopeptide (TPR) repeat protein
MPTDSPTHAALEIFCSYAHLDEALRNKLDRQLSPLRREGKIKSWFDRMIEAGEEWKGKIDEHLNSADIILLLISADFIHSDYCYDIEMARALERQGKGEARVIPVILRPCAWERTQFAHIQALPADAKPVTSWSNEDEALLSAAQGIGKVVDELLTPSARKAVPVAATTSAPLPVALPRPPVIGFVARRDTEGNDILARLKTELAPDSNQLIALWGPGGTGKTTLAAQVARELRAQFPQRLAWVSALARESFTLATLLDDIAAQLGRTDLRPLKLEDKAPQVAALLAEAPALVVLDNFETIAPAEQTRCLDFLAERAACSALVTTRDDTKRGDVRNIALAAMAKEEAQEFLRRLIGQTRKPEHFAALDADALIAGCEANPLVLQWVVKQIDLAHEPQTVLAELAQGKGDAAQRVFTRSFELEQVGDDGRAALLALSLFVPSASRTALAEAAGFNDDLPRLERAVERLSALWLVETTAGNERLLLRGLTRQLAQARLNQDAHAADYRHRFVAHFLRHARAHRQPTPEDYDALEAEKDNLLAAMDVAEELRDWQSIIGFAWVLAVPVDGMLSVRGYWDEALRCGEQGARAAEAAEDEYATVAFAGNAATVRLNRGEYEAARQTYERALAVMRRRGDEWNVAALLHQLGRIAQEQGDYTEARRLYEESLEIKKKLGNQSGIASTLHQLGRLAQDAGELAEARRLYEESLEIAKKLGNQSGIAISLHQLAVLAQEQGELAEARRLYEESLEIGKKLGNQRGIAYTLGQLGKLAYQQSEWAEARRYFEQTLKISQVLGDQLSIALSLEHLGLVAEQEGDRTEAARLLREALRIFERLGSPYAEVARKNLAWVEGAVEGDDG